MEKEFVADKIIFNKVMESIKHINEHEELTMTEEFEHNFLKILPTFFSYQEEEVSIKPKIIISKKIDNLLINIPSKSKIKLGEGDLRGIELKRHLKSILPFCNISWIVYFDIDEKINKYEYGIFRAYSKVDGFDTEEQLFLDTNEIEHLSLIYIKLISKFELFIQGKNGTNTIIDLRFHNEEYNSLQRVVNDVTLDLLKNSKKSDKNIKALSKVLTRLIESSHGSILIVLDNHCEELPTSLFTDGVWLEEPLNINQSYLNLANATNANEAIDTNEKFFALTGLLYEMANIDGALVLNTEGKIMGYNCFIKVNNIDDSREIAGGARKRAFHSLKTNDSNIIVGVLFISQDGEVSYERMGD